MGLLTEVDSLSLRSPFFFSLSLEFFLRWLGPTFTAFVLRDATLLRVMLEPSIEWPGLFVCLRC